MKPSTRFVLLCCASAVASLGDLRHARADLTEPNGLGVPCDPATDAACMNAGYKEKSLQKYFDERGETIDAKADALTEPAVFSPLCDFTATYVLNQAGKKYGVGWYNSDPASTVRPVDTDIHLIIPNGSPIGVGISSLSIRTDPAYAKGEVGFALVNPQLAFTEVRWNTLCSGCDPPAYWIQAIIYKSTKYLNAYYVAFEDSEVTNNRFGNDGDFNDQVFLLTGIQCKGAGVPCATGQMGVCADGVTDCDQSGTLVCKQETQQRAEICDGLDNDCNGTIDNDVVCPPDQICYRGKCLYNCATGEFPCLENAVCDEGFCVEPSCAGINCPTGEVCQAGICKGGCDGVVCPFDQICRGGRCFNPCAGIVCSGSRVCQLGTCIDTCECNGCETGTECSTVSGRCVEPGCGAISCAPGTHCAGGACVDDCVGVVCPAGQFCEDGECRDLVVTMPPPPTYDLGGIDLTTTIPGTERLDAGTDPDEQTQYLTGGGIGACRVAGTEGAGATGLCVTIAMLVLAIARRHKSHILS